MRSSGFLHLVGVGTSDASTISLGALDAIKSANELWLQELGPNGFEYKFVRDYLTPHKKIVNVYDYYRIPKLPRIPFYEFLAQRVVHLVRNGRKITFIFGGNPLIWVYNSQLFKKLSFYYGFPLRITPSISFLDTIYLHVPLLGMKNLQVRSQSLENPDVSPDIDCVLGQVFPSTREGHFRALRRLYPREHPIYIVGSNSAATGELCRTATLRDALSRYDAEGDSSVSLFIPSLKNAHMIKKLSSKKIELDHIYAFPNIIKTGFGSP